MSAGVFERLMALKRSVSSAFNDSSIGATSTCPKSAGSKAHQDAVAAREARAQQERLAREVESAGKDLHLLAVSQARSGKPITMELGEHRKSLILAQVAHEKAAAESASKLRMCRLENRDGVGRDGLFLSDSDATKEIDANDPCGPLVQQYRDHLAMAAHAQAVALAGLEKDDEVIYEATKRISKEDNDKLAAIAADEEAARKMADLEAARERKRREHEKQMDEMKVPLFTWPTGSKEPAPKQEEEKSWLQKKVDAAEENFLKKFTDDE